MELLIFRHPNKKNYELKHKLDGKKLHPSKYVKYLRVLISITTLIQNKAVTSILLDW